MRCSLLMQRTHVLRAVVQGSGRNFGSGIAGATRKAKQPDLPKYSFSEASGRVLHEIENAIEHMKKINDPFEVTKTEDELVVNSGKFGIFSFKLQPKDETLVYQSPVSGVVTYFYDTKEDHWLSIMDKHDMRGLVTRDFVRHHVGCPMFKF